MESRSGMDLESKIDELLEKQAFLVDIFPCTVPDKPDNRYFAVEDFFFRYREELGRKFLNILLKLYCYYDLTFVVDEKIYDNPGPDQMAGLITSCYGNCPDEEERDRSGDRIIIMLPEHDSMIVLDRDDQCMVVYDPDEELKEMIGKLVWAEGLFFYKAPADEDIR